MGEIGQRFSCISARDVRQRHMVTSASLSVHDSRDTDQMLRLHCKTFVRACSSFALRCQTPRDLWRDATVNILLFDIQADQSNPRRKKLQVCSINTRSCEADCFALADHGSS
jgi:hypothetical protein